MDRKTLVTVLTPVIVGIILLIIEYRTGWFVPRDSPPTKAFVVMLVVVLALIFIEYQKSYFTDWLGIPPLRSVPEHFSKWVDAHQREIETVKESIAFLVPLLALFVLVLFLLDQSIFVSQGSRIKALIFLLFMVVLAAIIIEPPMDSLTGTLIFIGLCAAYALVVHPARSVQEFFSEPFATGASTSNLKAAAYGITLTLLSAIWISCSIVVQYIDRKRDEIDRKIALYYESEEGERALSRANEERYRRVVSEWQSFCSKLGKEEREKLEGKCYPYYLKGWCLHIGCYDPENPNICRDLQRAEIRSKSHRRPSTLDIVAKAFRSADGWEFATLKCDDLSAHAFAALEERVKRIRDKYGQEQTLEK